MNLIEILKILFWILVVSGTVFACTKSLKRLFQVTSGLIILEIYNNVWDIGIWPIIQGIFGVYGVIGLTLSALILNFVVLRWYQTHCKTDWLGITVVDKIVLKAQQMQENKSTDIGFKKFWNTICLNVLLVLKKIIVGKWIPILVLIIFTDGFVVTAYYLNQKYGSVHHKLAKNDYIFLIVSTVVGCILWAFFTEWITLPAFRNIWQFVS